MTERRSVQYKLELILSSIIEELDTRIEQGIGITPEELVTIRRVWAAMIEQALTGGR